MYSIVVKNIEKKYKKKLVLDNISFEIEAGKVTGIIGPNGSGKSTLFKLIAGLITPNNGQVIYNLKGSMLKSEHLHSKIGSLIESPYLYPYLTGEENLRLILKQHDISKDEQINLLNNILGLDKIMKVKFKHCSMGMKQKLGIACAFVHNPDIIILDEPTNSLDMKAIEEVKCTINHYKQLNKTIIISSHILSDIQELCDNGIIINKGLIIDSYKKDSFINENEIYYKIYINKKDFPLVKNYFYDYTEELDSIVIQCSNIDNALKQLKVNGIEVMSIEQSKVSLNDYVKERINAYEKSN